MRIPFKKIFLSTLGRWVSSDMFAYRLPVSVKGVCFIDDQVVLLKNERGQWDLPGGKLNRREEVKIALEREVKEELGIAVKVDTLLEAYKVCINNQIDVLLIVYLCTTDALLNELVMSQESFGLQLVPVTALDRLELSNANLRSTVEKAYAKVREKRGRRE